MARAGVEWVPGEKVSSDSVRLVVVDGENRPVSGALVGTSVSWSDWEHNPPELKKGLTVHAPNRKRSIRTDVSGAAVVRKKHLFYPGWPPKRKQSLFVIEPSREIGGLFHVEPAHLGCEAVLSLSPLCRVSGTLVSCELARLKRSLRWTNTDVNWGTLCPAASESMHGRLELLLPEGSYRLDAYGSDIYGATRRIRIRRGQKSASVCLDLPAHRLSFLYGKPAPEFRKIKEWKNGAAVRLSDLKGKVVVLDFWGFWCGPCVHAMPELMELHDRFADQGLVIVAVHDDTVASIAELDARCSEARKEIWGGRELPFHVAIDGGGKCKISRRDGYARGATTALYGINGFPTTLVIDKRGLLLEGELPLGTEWAERRVQELLDA